jgi:hypothetical protein
VIVVTLMITTAGSLYKTRVIDKRNDAVPAEPYDAGAVSVPGKRLPSPSSRCPQSAHLRRVSTCTGQSAHVDRPG